MRIHSRIPVLLCLVIAIGALPLSSCGNATKADETELLALHERALEAHRRSDIDLLLQDEDDDYVISSRGEISRPAKAERQEFLGPYLRATRFEEYRDVVPPIAKAKGDLGWVVCQISARGTQRSASGDTASIAFVSSWIELYEKRSGRWVRIGNVSNFAEP